MGVVSKLVGKTTEKADETSRPKKKNKLVGRVQRSYYIDEDVYQALRQKAFDDDVPMGEIVNKILREGLALYLEG